MTLDGNARFNDWKCPASLVRRNTDVITAIPKSSDYLSDQVLSGAVEVLSVAEFSPFSDSHVTRTVSPLHVLSEASYRAESPSETSPEILSNRS